MYDRYTITLKNDELALTLGVEVSDQYSPQFNAAPTKKLPVITSQENQKLSFFHWGLMSMWSNNKTMSPKLYNLPLDSLLTKATYKRKLKTHRCVIPMDGFYAWKQVAKKMQVPHYFYFKDRRVFSVAAIWEESDESEGQSESFIMVTKPSTGSALSFNESMPAIMDTGSSRKWLEADDTVRIEDLLSTDISAELISHTVSPKIRDIDLNDVSFINPAPPSDQHGNYTLFT
ncbi:MAG: SOS response-associated peptidase [Cyclobacteriaceae bacterium]